MPVNQKKLDWLWWTLLVLAAAWLVWEVNVLEPDNSAKPSGPLTENLQPSYQVQQEPPAN